MADKDQEGAPIGPPPRTSGEEIAVAYGRRDCTRYGINADGTLYNEDVVLQLQLGGDLRLYEDLLRDDQVSAAFGQRRSAVVSAAWTVQPGADDAASKAAAEHLELQLKRTGWDRVTDLMLYAVHYGWSVAEFIWDVQDGLLGWSAIKVRNRRRFLVTGSGRWFLDTGIVDPANRIYADAPYFWAINTGADNSDVPYGLGLAHQLYWPVRFKRDALRFWMVYSEKFAMPTALGKFKPGETLPMRAALLQALSAIQTEAGVTIPEDMVIELLEAKRTGSSDYGPLVQKLDGMIQKIVLGQTLTTEVGSTGGNRALGGVHMSVRQDLVKLDADLICESFNAGPAVWLTAFNFPGATPPRVTREVEEAEDLAALATQLSILDKIGFRPTLEMVQTHWGADMEEKPEPPPMPPGAAGGFPPKAGQAEARAEFAASVRDLFPDQSILDGAIDLTEARFARLSNRMLQPVLEFAQDHTPQEMLEAMGDALPGWDADQLQEALARVLFVSKTWGRISAERRA